MLQLSDVLLNRPVLSLRTGHPVATTTSAIINPNNLKIEGFHVTDNRSGENLVLVFQDIREVIPQGLVINDHDVLTEPSELVRLEKVMEMAFDPLGKSVVTINKKRVGKVVDYATDTESMYIQKLYVAQSILKHLAGGNLGVDRTQIHEITPKKIIIQDLLKTVPAGAPVQA
jgi:sporulation protein YlmC with PRC-barrel domain